MSDGSHSSEPLAVPVEEPEAPATPAAGGEAPERTGDPAKPDPADAAAAYAAAAEPDHDSEAEAGAQVDVDPETELAAAEHEHQVVSELDELTRKAEKADEYLELAQRTRADFDNYRKRASRDAAAAQERGIAKLAKELLPAIDNLDRAVQAAETFAGGTPEETALDAESQLASGIRLVHADVIAALSRLGIESFSPTGEQFDPNEHEAVAQTPVEGAQSGTVIEVYQRGYRIGESVLRPARVVVAA